MPESTVAKSLRDGSITIEDGSGTPLSYSVAYENGDFSGSFPKADRVVIRDRHTIAGLRKGPDPVPTFSFSVHMREFADAASDTIVDVIERSGTWSASTSTAGDAYEQYLYDVTLTVEGTDHNDTADHTVKFSDVLLTWDFAEGDPDSITVSGECYGGVTRTGPA